MKGGAVESKVAGAARLASDNVADGARSLE